MLNGAVIFAEEFLEAFQAAFFLDKSTFFRMPAQVHFPLPRIKSEFNKF